MVAMVPLTVVLMAFVGLLVVLGAIARIVVLERRAAHVVVPTPLHPRGIGATGAGIAA